jgi:hypothetical protein
VLPLARIFPCHKEIQALARKMQGNKFHKEIARKNSHVKGNCKDLRKFPTSWNFHFRN